jgi:phage tail sheath gpL-like
MPLSSVVDPAYKKPGSFFKVSLGVGERSASSGAKRVLCVGNKTSGAPHPAATPVQVFSAAEAVTLFGAGSELHLMVTAAINANKSVELWCVVVAEAGTAATKTLTFSGTASADGTVDVWVKGKRATAAVPSGSTATATAAAVVAAINAQTSWPVTAANSTGTVTVTAKNTGPRGNSISIRSLASVGGITHTAVTGYMASGATMDSPTAALDSCQTRRFHLIAAPYYTATELGVFKTFIGAQAAPLEGRRSRVIACISDSVANTVTLTDAINVGRVEILATRNADFTPAEAAAAMAATVASARNIDPAANLDSVQVVGLPALYAQSDSWTASEENSLLNNGATPLVCVNGEMRISRSVTSYHQDANNADDFSILDTHKVDVPDYVADDLQVNFGQAFNGFKLGVDNADGEPPAPKVATPLSVRDWILSRLRKQDGNILVNVETLAPQLVVEADGSAAGRLNAYVPVDVIELFHQLAADVAQIG